MRQAGAHGAQPAIHSPTPRLQAAATNLRPDTWDFSCDSDRLGPRDLCWSKFENFPTDFCLGPMWKVRNFDLKALGGNSVVKIAEQKMMPFCNLCQTPQFLGTIFQVS